MDEKIGLHVNGIQLHGYCTPHLSETLSSLLASSSPGVMTIAQAAESLASTLKVNPEGKKNVELLVQDFEWMWIMNQNLISYHVQDLVPHKSEVKFFDLARPLVTFYRTLSQFTGTKFFVFFDNDVPELVYTDPILFAPIISNMVSNAVKFSPGNSEIIIRAYRKERLLFLSVEDQGEGIPRDQMEQIFYPYHKVDIHKQGAGLGLTVCQRNITALGGTITADSEEGEGSTFTICLPLYS